MMNPFKLWLLAGVFAAACIPAVAEVVGDLYEAQVLVPSRDQADQQPALGQALGLVVAKLSGQREAASRPEVVEAASTPGRFVQQFQYRSVPGQGLKAPKLYLWAKFDPLVVEALVRDAGLPLWGRQRPTVLAWVGVDGDSGREILSSDDATGLAEHFLATGRDRGIPILLPLMDLEDQINVSPDDLWSGVSDKISAASSRYAAEALLVARLVRLDALTWEGQFELQLPDGGQRWEVRDAGPLRLLKAAMDEASDRIAARYAGLVGFGAAAVVNLRVFGVSSLSAYARTLDYLASIDQVESVALTGLSEQELRLQVNAQGGADGFRQLVQVGGVLDLLPTSSFGEELHFRLRQ